MERKKDEMEMREIARIVERKGKRAWIGHGRIRTGER